MATTSHASPILPGVTILVTVQGTIQGQFLDTGVAASPNQGQIPALNALKFSYGATSPTDLSTGLATGKLQYKPFVMTKEPGTSSPQFFSALVNNEMLKVIIQLLRVNTKGEPAVQRIITLTDARISDFQQYAGDDDRWLEDVAFVFQKMEIVDNPSQDPTAYIITPGVSLPTLQPTANIITSGVSLPSLQPTSSDVKDKILQANQQVRYKQLAADKLQKVTPSLAGIAPTLPLNPTIRFRS